MNDQNRTRRMDFNAGRRQISPEMLEAQRRLSKRLRTTTATTTATASSSTINVKPSSHATPVNRPARPHISPKPASVASGPMTRAAASHPRPRPVSRPAAAPRPVATNRPTVVRHPRPASVRPVGHPMNRARNVQKMPHKEPSGPLGSKNLETVEFDSLDTFSSIITPEKQLTTEQPAVQSKKDSKKLKKAEKPKDGKAKSFLSGKSPFINTLNIEKRPLSGHSVNKSKVTLKATIAPVAKKVTPSVRDNVPTMVSTKRKSRKSSIALIIAIFLTVVLGAVVGTFIYLAFFQ